MVAAPARRPPTLALPVVWCCMMCRACRRMRDPEDFWPKQRRCKPCAAEQQAARRAAHPGREAELKRQQRARRALRQQAAEVALLHVLRELPRIAEDFAPDLDADRADDLRDSLSGLLVDGIAAAEDALGLEPGSALNVLAGRQHPHL